MPQAAPLVPAATTGRAREIVCFKCQGRGHIAQECPNQRVMTITEAVMYHSDDDWVKEDTAEVEEVLYLEVGEALVSRRVLSAQPATTEDLQRENIFHTKCKVLGKICSLIIDGGSCTNVASTYMVEKLSLPKTAHSHPYKLWWLNDQTELRIHEQVKVPFSIGTYTDEVMCDVVPMQAGHILLGRPWQYDHAMVHEGRSNCYTIRQGTKVFKLAPLSPQQVQNMQPVPLTKRQPNLLIKSKQLSHLVKSGQKEDRMSFLVIFRDGQVDMEQQLPQEMEELLEQYKDVFPEDIPPGLPPIRGIEHAIDFIPGAVLPNRPAYRVSPTESKELEE